jgi:hypothetical protein
MHSWKQYCNVSTASNPWNAAYKLATGNIKSCSSLSTLRRPTELLLQMRQTRCAS